MTATIGDRSKTIVTIVAAKMIVTIEVARMIYVVERMRIEEGMMIKILDQVTRFDFLFLKNRLNYFEIPFSKIFEKELIAIPSES